MERGNINAPILIVGDVAEVEDIQAGLPFMGAAGYKLNKLVSSAGLKLDTHCVSTVLFPHGGTNESEEAFRLAGDRIRGLIKQLPNLRVIATVGDRATRAFCRGGRVDWDKKAPTIHSVRGSIYPYPLRPGVVVVPVLPPRAADYKPEWQFRMESDWRKIATEAFNPMPLPTHDIDIEPNLDKLRSYRDRAKKNRDVLSVDIETWGGSIKCIGFAFDSKNALVVPTEWDWWDGCGPNSYDLITNVMGLIKQILESSCPKVLQNGLFDAWWLKSGRFSMDHCKMDIANYLWDTLGMHHALHPLDNHSLDYLSSVFTRNTYWKDEAKQAEEIMRVARQGMDKLYVYNGLDCCITRELFSVFFDMLQERGMTQFYLKHYAKMHQPLLRMMTNGIQVNEGGFRIEEERHIEAALEDRDMAAITAGVPLWRGDGTKAGTAIFDYVWKELIENQDLMNEDETMNLLAADPNIDGKQPGKFPAETIERKYNELMAKGISDTLLADALFNVLRAPKGNNGKDGAKFKVDSVELKKVRNTVADHKTISKRDQRILDLVDLTISHRRHRKLSSFCNTDKIDSDGRVRCSYKFTTKTGRLASSSNPAGTGYNLQNVDREVRHLWLPDDGHIMLECDLSQAEARVVAALTGDESMIEVARSLPHERDTHTENAQIIFGRLFNKELSFDEITKEQRYLGKRVVHASSYGMHGGLLSDVLLKDGYVLTPKECNELIAAYMEMRPAIPNWQRAVRRTIMDTGRLYTSWGRKVQVDKENLSNAVYRFGYSYVPQSEIGDLLNQYGLFPLDEFLEKRKFSSRIVLQVHDAVILSAHPKEVWPIMNFLKENLEQERVYGEVMGFEVPLSIPAEFVIGDSWAKGTEFKKFPSEDEVLEAVSKYVEAT